MKVHYYLSVLRNINNEIYSIIYCKAPFAFNSFIKSSWEPTSTKVFAAIVPDAATPGNPIPGNVVSPHASKPLIGVFGPGSSHC